MANSNFVVQNGLTVGPLTIDAVTGDITTTGNVTLSGTGSLGVSQIAKNDSSITINDTGTGSNVVIQIDGSLASTVSAAGLNLTASTASTTYTDGALVVAGGVGIAGNVHIQSTKILHVGPDLIGAYSNVLAQFNANVNSYSQILLQNISNGTSASADVVIQRKTEFEEAFGHLL